MRKEYITVIVLFGAAIALMVALELITQRDRTPIPDAFNKAFDDGH